jgi:hypothetical protein
MLHLDIYLLVQTIANLIIPKTNFNITVANLLRAI